MLEQLNSKLLAPSFTIASAPTLNYLSTIKAVFVFHFASLANLKG